MGAAGGSWGHVPRPSDNDLTSTPVDLSLSHHHLHCTIYNIALHCASTDLQPCIREAYQWGLETPEVGIGSTFGSSPILIQHQCHSREEEDEL